MTSPGTGNSNGVFFGTNADFSQTSPVGASANVLDINGEMWIGSTALNAGGTHINVGKITSPNGTLSVGYSSPNITLDIAGGSFTWQDASGTISALKQHGYFITTTSTATLPASPSVGDTIVFIVDTTNILTIQASPGQTIRLGNAISAAAGTAINTARGDAITLVYRSTDTSWITLNAVGNWTIT